MMLTASSQFRQRPEQGAGAAAGLPICLSLPHPHLPDRESTRRRLRVWPRIDQYCRTLDRTSTLCLSRLLCGEPSEVRSLDPIATLIDLVTNIFSLHVRHGPQGCWQEHLVQRLNAARSAKPSGMIRGRWRSTWCTLQCRRCMYIDPDFRQQWGQVLDSSPCPEAVSTRSVIIHRVSKGSSFCIHQDSFVN